MKVAISTSGDNLDAPVDRRFGRAPKFLIYDTETEQVEIIENQQNLGAAQGAGIQAAQNVARSNAECLLTGHCGPNAYRVLKAAGIRIYTTNAPTVRQSLELLREGRLVELHAADVEGHWA